MIHTATYNANNLSFHSISAPDGNTYSKVLLSEISDNIAEPGKPKLPVHTLKLMIPFGKEVSDITCTNIVTESFSLNNRVCPAEVCDSIGQVFAVPDSAIYNSNNVFPLTPIMNWKQGYFDGNNNIVSIGICPFEYYPTLGKLNQITSVMLTITYVDGFRGGIQNQTRLQKTQKLYDSILYNIVDNPEVIPIYHIPSTLVEELGSTDAGLPVYEYVVITHRDYVEALHDFVGWKRQKGYKAGIITIEEICENYPDEDVIGTNPICDKPGSVRQYLREAKQQGTSYAFIVGMNNSDEEIRFGFVENDIDSNTYWFNRPSTDWYFSDLTGDWNLDNDDNYGEPYKLDTVGNPIGDNTSAQPSLFVGRLLCSSTEDISNWVSKLITYEKNPGNGDASYLVRCLMNETQSFSTENIAEYTASYLPQDFQTEIVREILYENGYSYPTGSELVDKYNSDNWGFWCWFNHGGTGDNESGILVSQSSNPERDWKLQAEDGHDHANAPEEGNGIDNLNNIGFPSIVYSISCSVMPFEKNKKTSPIQRRNCGESYTVGGLFGGVAFLGFCVDNGTGSYSCRDFVRELNKAALDNTYSHLGVLESVVKQCNNSTQLHFRYNHNLIGDPECQMWTKIPDNMEVLIEASDMVSYVKGNVRVDVDGLNIGEQVTVTLYSEDDIFQVGQFVVGKDHHIMFDSVFPTSLKPILVTVTCYNHLPYEKYIPVTEECKMEIASDEVWINDISVGCDIVVKSNATLTIKCNVGMNTNCKIEVAPQGKLIIDGGKLHSAVPGYQWQGVRVCGTGVAGWQGMFNGEYTQGYIQLKNNAQINDAKVAIDLWDGIHLNTTGGIVYAKDASFRNNGMAVRAKYFQNTNPMNASYTYDYAACFYNCDFGVDKGYSGEVFRHHIELVSVKGVKFKGCRFYIQDCPMGLSANDNSAIYSYNASFMVDRYCTDGMVLPCPEENYVRSTFNGFNMGINAVQSGKKISSFTVKNSIFSDNTYGIRVLGSANPTVLFSDFIIGDNGRCGAGVYLTATPIFHIEENSFTKASNASIDVDYFGIVAIETQGINDIYRNVFTNLTCANFAKGRNFINNNYPNQGLTYSCNNNFGNSIDFLVPSPPIFYYINGIAQCQGNANIASGNTFSQDGVRWQFYNGGTSSVTYYYNQNNPLEEPQDGYINNVKKIQASSSNDCLSHYENNGVLPVLSSEQRQQREADYNAAFGNYFNTKTLYDSYIDGGSTSEELRDIFTALPEDAWELRTQLLNHSPYLSQEVLRAAADRTDVFSESVLLEILASNPEELSRDTLLKYLEDKENPLPEYMIDILREVAKGNTYRSVLESLLVSYKHGYCLAAQDIIRSIMNDTIIDLDDLRNWLGNLNEINADRQIVASYLSEGRDSSAFALANLFPSLYELEGDAMIEHNGYVQMLDFYRTLDQQNRTIFELSADETKMVDSLNTYGIGIVQTMAKGVLEVVGSFTIVDCPEILISEDGNGGRGGKTVIRENMNKATGFSVNVKPNPATAWTVLDFTLPNEYDKATLTVMNALGITVYDTELQGNQGQHVLDLCNMAEGLYFYTVRCKEFVQNGKLLIVK